MKTALMVCLMLVAIGLPFWILYWEMFRPVCLTRLRYQLFKARDDLRILALRNGLADSKQAYRIIEGRCNALIRVLDYIDIQSVCTSQPDQRIKLEVQRDALIIAESPPAVRAIWDDVFRVAQGAIVLNSPGLVLPLLPIVLLFQVCVLWFNRARRGALAVQARVWAAVYLGGERLQPA